MSASIILAEQQFAADARMVDLKRHFLEICFNDFIFVPNLKRIQPRVRDNTIACVVDAFNQYTEQAKVMEKVSKVSIEKQLKWRV